MFDEIIINVRNNEFNQIVFIKDCVIEYVGPYEPKYHSEYLNLDITIFKFLQD
jgi:hypothetical protein